MLMHVGTPLLGKEGLWVVDYLCDKKNNEKINPS